MGSPQQYLCPRGLVFLGPFLPPHFEHFHLRLKDEEAVLRTFFEVKGGSEPEPLRVSKRSYALHDADYVTYG
jgi:hypothetical protein